jgi:hypothetical protein
MEVLVIRADWRDDMEAWALMHFGVHRLPVRPSLLKLWVEIISVALVAGGVFGELAIGIVITSINGTLRSHEATLRGDSDQLIALVTREAAEAKDRASQADLKRIALENRIADIFGPRQLTSAQVALIAGRLKGRGMGGTKVDVYVYGVDNPYSLADFEDSHNVAIAVVRALAAAKLDVGGWLLQSCWGASASNVVITTTGTGNAANAFAIGSGLIKAFQPEIGTDPNVETNIFPPAGCQNVLDLDKRRPNHRKNDATITIVVGRKVQPILTREMLEPADEQKQP